MSIGFQGCRVLVVEDEPLVHLALEGILSDLGCEVVGPVIDYDDALFTAQSEPGLSVALLDVNVWGQVIFPVAETLRDREVALIFCSGMGEENLPDDWRSCSRLHKPYSDAAVLEALKGALNKA